MVQVYYRLTNAQRYNELHREAYRLLSDALQSGYGISADVYTLCKTEHGKPYYRNCPYHFSISHTDGLLVVAISSSEVGVDAEPLDRVVGGGVAKRFLQSDTADIWDWTCYESIGKLFAVGIPFSKEEINKPYVTRRYTDIPGYAVCCACGEDAFWERSIQI